MGHLGFMKEEYRALHGRLMKAPIGMPIPEDRDAREAMYELLQILFPPEHARLAAQLPLNPSKASTIAKLVGRPEAEVEGQLEEMCNRGVTVDLISTDGKPTRYVLAPPVVGFFEFSLMRRRDDIPQKALAQAMSRYMHGDPAFSREIAGETPIGRTLVHETALDGEVSTEILSYERASELIRESKGGAVSLCYCRHKAEHLGHACDTPQEICTSLHGGAEWAVRRGFGRRASESELLDILDESRERGLVQMGDNVEKRPTFICHCCGCCCEVLTGLNTHGVNNIIQTSNFIAAFDDETCKGCSRCARACPAHAISMAATPTQSQRRRELRPKIDDGVCLGCGVCVAACRKNAIRMAPRPQRVLTPENTIARIVGQAIDNGRMQHLLLDTGAKPNVLKRVLAAVLGLPPARRLQAAKQSKSIFVKQAVERTRGIDI